MFLSARLVDAKNSLKIIFQLVMTPTVKVRQEFIIERENFPFKCYFSRDNKQAA